MARPKKPPEEKRAYQTPSIRLTPEENDVFMGLVFQSGMSKTDFIRHAILQKKITVIHKKGFDYDQRQELRAIAHNINQITKRYHATGKTPPPSFDLFLDRIHHLTIDAMKDA